VLALGNFVNHARSGSDRVRPIRRLEPRTEVLEEHFPPGIGSPITAVVDAGERRR